MKRWHKKAFERMSRTSYTDRLKIPVGETGRRAS
jgi:hypothetical protein